MGIKYRTFYIIEKLRYRKNLILLATILKLKIDDHAGIWANVNIDFQIPHALSFLKICYFANLHKFWTKVHSEPDYYYNTNLACLWNKVVGYTYLAAELI